MRSRVLAFIVANPGCSVMPIVNGVDGVDAADVWNSIHELERDGWIRMDRPDGSR